MAALAGTGDKCAGSWNREDDVGRIDLKALAAAILLAAGVWLAGSQARAAPACASEGRVHYLCGPANVEDMVLAPGTRWIIASGMAPQSGPGHIYLIDSRTRTFADARLDLSGPARAPYGDCPGPLDPAKLAPHGLGLRPGKAGRSTLYVVNHGGRQSIEVFDVDAGGARPMLRWIGCEALPDNASGNGVAPLPDGGFAASKFQDAGDPAAFQKMAALQKTGALYVWTPGKGFKALPGGELSGDNGVETSPDGRFVFVNAWPERRVVRLDRRGLLPPASVSLDFLPDNLRAEPGGQLLVAGQGPDIKTLLSCERPKCPHAWTVVRLDPASLKVAPLLHIAGTEAFSDATSTLRVGDELWIGTYRGDRVAWISLK
jgi:hypothetical protein